MHNMPVAIASFASTLSVSHRWRSRASFERWQQHRLHAWLQQHLHTVRFYRDLPRQLDALPVTDKAMLMSAFEDFNQAGITAAEAWKAVDAGDMCKGYNVGASTGTSGNQGLFVISDTERFVWLGVILAKALPEFLWRRQRVAIILPRNTSLYNSALQTGRIDLKFFDVGLGPENWTDELEEFSPTCIVAPPKILRYLAEQKTSLRPAKLFSAAETLDSNDRTIIETFFSVRLGQIYMATEGLLGVSCRHGRLHLAEDAVAFELEPVGDGLVTPLITSFRRTTQIMARYRMNDLLRLSQQPCSCGSPLTAVDEVVGRMDDAFRLAAAGQRIIVTPDVLRDTVLKSDRRIDDFRIVQTGPQAVELLLPPDLPDDAAETALSATRDLFLKRRTVVDTRLVRTSLPLETGRKLRRVQCRIARQNTP
ncbi:MAG: F390 synthetase-related protein [Pseudomonadota bacterium]